MVFYSLPGLLAMESIQLNPRSQPSEHAYCRMSQLLMGRAYVALTSDLTTHMATAKPNCTIDGFTLDTGLILVGPPQEVSEAYQMAMEFLCTRLNIQEVQLLRTTTTTNDYYHELRTTTTTNYDYDEIRLRRNTITTTPVGGSPPSDLREHYY